MTIDSYPSGWAAVAVMTSATHRVAFEPDVFVIDVVQRPEIFEAVGATVPLLNAVESDTVAGLVERHTKRVIAYSGANGDSVSVELMYPSRQLPRCGDALLASSGCTRPAHHRPVGPGERHVANLHGTGVCLHCPCEPAPAEYQEQRHCSYDPKSSIIVHYNSTDTGEILRELKLL